MDVSTIENVALWVIVGVIVVALLLAIIIRKIVGKIITLVIAAVLIFFGWQQRAEIIDFKNETTNTVGTAYCNAAPTFFGMTVTFPGCDSGS